MPWAEMMQVAVRMGISPEAFWRLSLKEWRMLTVAVGGAQPLGRGDFERMVERWPDGEGGSSPSTASRSPSPSLRDGEER